MKFVGHIIESQHDWMRLDYKDGWFTTDTILMTSPHKVFLVNKEGHITGLGVLLPDEHQIVVPMSEFSLVFSKDGNKTKVIGNEFRYGDTYYYIDYTSEDM